VTKSHDIEEATHILLELDGNLSSISSPIIYSLPYFIAAGS